jgi:serine/threonine protein kinase
VDPVIDQVTLDGKRYLILEQLGSRDRFRVFDSTAGFHGDYRVLTFLPRSRETEQQIEVLRRLAEKNLHFPKIIQCVRQGDKLGVVSTWIWGIDLRDYLGQVRDKKIVRPSTREVCRLANKLAHGLAHLHVKANVVHGDIKPANIVLEKDPTRLVLIDFGSAWPTERAAKKSPGDGVSFPYVAPEQLMSDTVPDFRADIFSLSVVLFELLTLDIPFDGAGGQAGLRENRAEFSAKYQPPSKFITDAHLLPIGCVPILDKVLERGLALDPNGRFSDRNDWLRAMDNLLFHFREGTRLGFFGRKFLGLLDWWSNWRKGSSSSG